MKIGEKLQLRLMSKIILIIDTVKLDSEYTMKRYKNKIDTANKNERRFQCQS